MPDKSSKPVGKRGRPFSGRHSYTHRMKPETHRILTAAWGPIGPHLDLIAAKLKDAGIFD